MKIKKLKVTFIRWPWQGNKMNKEIGNAITTEKFRYICATCGSTEENKETAYCVNDHDNWLEYADFGDPDLKEHCEAAMRNLGLTEQQLKSRLL